MRATHRFIWATKRAIGPSRGHCSSCGSSGAGGWKLLPKCCASAMAASLPEGSSSPYSSSRALYASPALSLALVPLFQPYSGVHAAKEAANVEMTTFCDRKRRLLSGGWVCWRSRMTRAVTTLVMEAGWRIRPGRYHISGSPVVASATIQLRQDTPGAPAPFPLNGHSPALNPTPLPTSSLATAPRSLSGPPSTIQLLSGGPRPIQLLCWLFRVFLQASAVAGLL
mmetsp:Transcript_10584/g.25085  ORF Transcript_10584/g.25085 Transcript_10584/m.25085 type:complete len:225 (-) Transcript_10584:440-1114(-)